MNKPYIFGKVEDNGGLRACNCLVQSVLLCYDWLDHKTLNQNLNKDFGKYPLKVFFAQVIFSVFYLDN